MIVVCHVHKHGWAENIVVLLALPCSTSFLTSLLVLLQTKHVWYISGWTLMQSQGNLWVSPKTCWPDMIYCYIQAVTQPWVTPTGTVGQLRQPSKVLVPPTGKTVSLLKDLGASHCCWLVICCFICIQTLFCIVGKQSLMSVSGVPDQDD